MKRVEGVTEKLLECAKEEFLNKGYFNASLRNIAEKAGSSKGAIYIRYTDKHSLYRTIVQPAIDELCEMMRKGLTGFEALTADIQKKKIFSYSKDGQAVVFIDYIYEHYTEFRILFTSGEQTIVQEFIHRLVEMDVHSVMQFIDKTGNDAITSCRLTPDLAHLLSSAFYSGVFEVVIHDMSKQDAVSHFQRMGIFYNAGWKTIFDG